MARACRVRASQRRCAVGLLAAAVASLAACADEPGPAVPHEGTSTGGAGSSDDSAAAQTETTGEVPGDSSADASSDAPSTGEPTGCTLDGVTLLVGESATFYDAETVPFGETCDDHGQLRVCEANGLTGDAAFSFAACTESLSLHVYVEQDGDDEHSGLTPRQPVATIQRAVEIVDGWADAYDDATVHVGAGRFEHAGELWLRHPIALAGVEGGGTTFAFAIDRDEASIRVVSSDVSIAHAEIEVDLVESLSDGIHVGGRGEYGTAITVGRYLHTEAHEVVAGVSIHDIVIRRTNFTAAGITIIGRASDVDISNIEIFGRVSTAIIVHWGGHTTVAPAPAALEDPRYAVLTSYHPHDLRIEGMHVEDSARFAAVSSAYDVELRDFDGPTSTILFLLPGDEVDRFAAPEDRGQVMTNLRFEDFDAELIADEGEHAIRMTSVGTSRMDGLQRILPMDAVTLEDIAVVSVARPGGLSYRYGVNANGVRGTQIRMLALQLADVASWEYDDTGATQASFGVYLRNASGVLVDGLATQARYGVGIVDSQGVTIDNSTLTYTDEPHSSANAFGVYVAENTAPQGGNNDLVVANTTITGYEYGVRYLDDTSDKTANCDTLVLDNVTFADVGTQTLCVEN